MLTYPNINPIAFQIGPVAIYWYGIMYIIGFAGAFWLCNRRRLQVTPPWTRDELIDLFFYGAIGVVVGGTWGYLLFYEPHIFWQDPLSIFQFRHGRSFHGGLLGVVIAVVIYCIRHQRRFLAVMDFVAPATPIGLGAGRLGNFINGELWGRPTTVSWGMVFPHADTVPRHPSQLYEFALEGILLFIILQLYSLKPRPTGSVTAIFLIFYGLFRFIAEFFREPGLHETVIFGTSTMGQMLSIPMIMIGMIILIYSRRS